MRMLRVRSIVFLVSWFSVLLKTLAAPPDPTDSIRLLEAAQYGRTDEVIDLIKNKGVHMHTRNNYGVRYPLIIL